LIELLSKALIFRMGSKTKTTKRREPEKRTPEEERKEKEWDTSVEDPVMSSSGDEGVGTLGGGTPEPEMSPPVTRSRNVATKQTGKKSKVARKSTGGKPTQTGKRKTSAGGQDSDSEASKQGTVKKRQKVGGTAVPTAPAATQGLPVDPPQVVSLSMHEGTMEATRQASAGSSEEELDPLLQRDHWVRLTQRIHKDAETPSPLLSPAALDRAAQTAGK
jgi:hypothetical protein